MTRYIVQRLVLLPLLLFLFSVAVFAIVQAPPGNFLTAYTATLASSGTSISAEHLAALRKEYGLDQPVYVQYLKWMQNLLRGNLGLSLEYQRPNADLISERLVLTVVLALLSFVFTWVVAIPAGIYSATHQRSPLDYVFTWCRPRARARPPRRAALHGELPARRERHRPARPHRDMVPSGLPAVRQRRSTRDRCERHVPRQRLVLLAVPSTEQDDVAFDAQLTRTWLPVDMYIGGEEHAVLHLLYSRFITMALHDAGLLEFDEPFTTFRKHGLLIKDGAKMSKSRGNVVIPDRYIEQWGADTFRTYLMFLGPYQEGGDFRDEGLQGPYGFLNRLWETVVPADDLG